MENFVAESVTLNFVQLGDLLKGGRVLGNQSAFLEKGDHVLQARLLGELLDIVEERVTGNASQWILNSVRSVLENDRLMCCG